MSSDAIEDAKRHFADMSPAAAMDWAARQDSETRYEITQWALGRLHAEEKSVQQSSIDRLKRQSQLRSLRLKPREMRLLHSADLPSGR